MDIHRAVDATRREVAAACLRCGRHPEQVRLIAVTKQQGPEVLPVLAAAGILDVGENRLEHQVLMRDAAASSPATSGLRFHAIGRIQGRQLAKLVPLSSALHSLADPGHVQRLAAACADRTDPLAVFLQVNTSGEAAKAGVAPEALADFLHQCHGLPGLHVVGLMTMAEEGAAESAIRLTFRRLRQLAEHHGLPRLSMGMSQDFPIAIEEGATDIRVGTRLFT